MIRLKITCYTPKGKAKSSSKSFGMKYLDVLNKPVETKIINSSKFYYIYEYEDQKKVDKIINKKIPKAEQTIRAFYINIIGIVKRANNLGKKGAWHVDRVRRWILKRFKQKGGEPKDIEEFLDAVNLTDEQEMLEFLSGPLFEYEVLEK